MRFNNNKDYYSVKLLKCNDLNIILNTIKRDRTLIDTIPDVLPVWNCQVLQKLRKKDKIPHFELTIMKNGERMNDFDEFMKNN